MSLASIVRRLWIAPLLLVSAGCDLFTGPGTPSVELTLPASVFAPGEDLPLSVSNRTSRPWYGTSGCNQGIERLVDGEWTPVYGSNCFAIAEATPLRRDSEVVFALTEVAPGATVVMTWTLPSDALPGSHRIRLGLSGAAAGDGDVYVFVSPLFEVAPR